MKNEKQIIIFTYFFLCCNLLLYCQKIQNVYWYNIPSENVKIKNKYFITQSVLTFEIDSNLFDLEVYAMSDNADTLYEKEINHKILNYNVLNINKDIDRIVLRVPFLPVLPTHILIKNKQNNEIVSFNCDYSKLSGTISSSDKSIKYVGIIPDDFNDQFFIYLQTDSSGYYQCFIPKRKYTFILAVDNNYAQSTLETWYNNIQITRDKELNFKICNGEIYNLHIWKNKGGGNSLFITFRPMIIDKQIAKSKIIFNKKSFELIENSIYLSSENIDVSINGTLHNIISMQQFHETGTPPFALLSYLLQIELEPTMLNSEENVLELNFKKLIKEQLYIGNAKIDFNYDQL